MQSLESAYAALQESLLDDIAHVWQPETIHIDPILLENTTGEGRQSALVLEPPILLENETPETDEATFVHTLHLRLPNLDRIPAVTQVLPLMFAMRERLQRGSTYAEFFHLPQVAEIGYLPVEDDQKYVYGQVKFRCSASVWRWEQ